MATTSSNLGWALTMLLRDYLKQVDTELAGLPGGSRGFMMLSAIAETSCDSQIALAERLGLDRTTVTYLLDGLEKDDLLKRVPDPADRRVRHVNLTATGSARLAELRRNVDQIEAQVLGRLSRGEAEQFGALLAKASGLTASTSDAEACQAIIETSDQLASKRA